MHLKIVLYGQGDEFRVYSYVRMLVAGRAGSEEQSNKGIWHTSVKQSYLQQTHICVSATELADNRYLLAN